MATPRAKAAAPRAPEAAPAPDMGHNNPPQPMAREVIRPTIPGRAVALNRAGVPIQRAGAESGVNTFFIPAHLPPPNWSWEWKRESVKGETDPFYMSQLQQVGWEPVMYESYPGVFAPEYDDTGKKTVGPVRRNGLQLMERAAVLTEEARRDEKRKADERIGNAKAQYNRLDTSASQTAVFDQSAQQASYIRQSQVTLPPLGGGNGGPTRQPIE